MDRAFSKILILVILIALAGGGFFAWQYLGAPEEEEKDETSNWKTYTNAIHQFEVKYPENWMTREYSPGRQTHLPEEKRTIIISFASNQESLIEEKGINIFVSPPDFTSWESYIQAENAICKEEIPIQNIKDLIQEGKIKQHCFMGESLYFSSFADRIFKFYVGTEGRQIFNQMLSTFRFIEIEDDKLTLEELKNAEYYTTVYKETVQLKDGYYRKEYPGMASGLEVGIYKDKIAFGDLNNDGKRDTAVVLYSTGGGSGTFRELAIMINEDGKPSYFTSKFLGDRVIINSITIESGVITLNMVIHGPEDGMCCPSVEKIFKYKLSGNQLLEIIGNETADWKIYRNEEYGFEMKYPDGLSIEPGTASSQIWFTDYSVNEFNCDFSFYFFSSEGKRPCANIAKAELTIGGTPAEREKDCVACPCVEPTDCPGNIKYSFGPNKDNRCIDTWMVTSKALNESGTSVGMIVPECEEIFNQILSTFRFLE